MKRRLLLLLGCLPLAAQAQQVWRCGADGRSYGQQPCPEGRRIEVPGPLPPEDVAAARMVAAREAALADRLRRERIEVESRPAGSGLIAIAAEPAPVRPQPVVRPRRLRPPARS